MAQQSMFWTTDGTGDGVVSGYSQQRIYDLWASIFVTDEVGDEGVFPDIGSELNITGTALPLLMEDGSAVAHGFIYENLSNFSVSGSSVPAIDTTGGRINIVTNWATQTCRIIANQSADGVAALPALIQNAGVEWHTPLYTYTVTTGGLVTVTDVRTFCHFATRVETDMIENDAITSAKLATDSVTADAILANAVDSAEIAANAVGADEIAADSVDDTKVGNRVPQFYRRQGGNASLWNVPGGTGYTPTAVRMQGGVKDVPFTFNEDSASVEVTFPTAFAYAPLVFVTISEDLQDIKYAKQPWVLVDDVSTTVFTIYIELGAEVFSASGELEVSWFAVGPE